MNYRVDHVDGLYRVLEKITNTYVAEFLHKESAMKLMRSLNGGKGFDGWTPTFFTKPNMLRGD